MDRKKFLQDYFNALEAVTVRRTDGGRGNCPIGGASSDSRQIRPGWLFCAVKGSVRDGHRYIPQALAAGAVAVVLEDPCEVPEDIAVIQVKDGYRALALAAECMYGFPAAGMRNIGITGTNGKTTCAFLLRRLFRHHGCECGMIGTVEYDLGKGDVRTADRTTPTPFELQGYLAGMAENQVDSCILEVSSHALAQGRLGSMKFSGAIFTNLTQDHLDYHKTMEAYYQCKKRLFTEMMAGGDAPVIVNVDDAWGRRLTGELSSPPAMVIRRGGAGDSPNPGECILVIGERQNQKTGFQLRFAGENWDFVTPLAGEYNFYNLASVICLARCLGLSYREIADTVSTAEGAPGRLQACPGTGAFSVFVDYAHTDDAVAKALQALRPLCRRRLSIVFGCGGDRDRTKRPKMGRAAARFADRLYVTSDNPRGEEPGAIIADILEGIPDGTDYAVVPDRRQAIARALREAETGDIILIAGKGHEEYQEIKGVKYPFSDFKCVKEVLHQ